MSSPAPLPDLAQVVAGLLQRVPPEQQPLLIALAERLAAERYRGWAAAVGDPARRAPLLACAAREEDIAVRIESLYADAQATQQRLRAQLPDLIDINAGLFAGRPLPEQFAIQAQGERLGAATWRALARQTTDDTRRAVLLACAELEEESAVVLEAFLAEER